jgi:hypothetical protein
MRFLPLLLLPLFLAPAMADDSAADAVTTVGRTLLPSADLVGRGRVESVQSLTTGVTLARFKLEEVLHGRETGRSILIVSPDRSEFPAIGLPVLYFLKRLGRGRYEVGARVELGGAEGPFRLQAMKRFLEIEALENPQQKRRELHDYLMGNLTCGTRFLVWNAAREMAGFSRDNAGFFTLEDLMVIRRKNSVTRDKVLRDLLTETIENLSSVVARAPAVEDAPEVPVAPEPERPSLKVLELEIAS